MGIFCKGKIRGEKGEVETEVFLNTGSDYVILPRSVSERIKPKPVGEEEFELADGSIVPRKVYEIEVEVEDHKGERRKGRAFCTVEERRDVAIGFEVMRDLRLVPDPAKGVVYFV